jgi:hypothetical protein
MTAKPDGIELLIKHEHQHNTSDSTASTDDPPGLASAAAGDQGVALDKDELEDDCEEIEKALRDDDGLQIDCDEILIDEIEE